jgi:hypothetical protein
MDDDVASGYGEDQKHHWTHFETAFTQAFTNLGEKISVESQLHSLKMEKGDIDTYIMVFNKLLAQARYKEMEQGALNMFKKGLPGPLNVQIINNSQMAPNSLMGWQKATREQQLKYLETKEFTGKNLLPAQQAFAKRLRNQYRNFQKKDLNAMDVDSGGICFQKLMEQEHKELSAKGICFRCCKQGHISKDCPQKNGSTEYGRPAPTQIKEQSVLEQPKTLNMLMGDLKAFLKNDENKEQYFSAMVEQGFV